MILYIIILGNNLIYKCVFNYDSTFKVCLSWKEDSILEDFLPSDFGQILTIIQTYRKERLSCPEFFFENLSKFLCVVLIIVF